MNRDAMWVVWNKGGSAPVVVHSYRSDAVTEAERLARKVPGATFVVLQATDIRCFDAMQRTTLVQEDDEDEVPF